MARAKKKVQGKKIKIGKKFYIILSSVVTAVLLGLATLFVVLYFKDNTEPSTADFTEERFLQYKQNFSDVDNILNGSVQHIFFFLYDSEEFDIEENNSDRLIYNSLISFLNQVELANERSMQADGIILIEFFLLDVSLVGNSAALTSSQLGSLNAVPSFGYVYGDRFTTETPDRDENKETIAGSSLLVNIINNANEYVQRLSALINLEE